jgi:hypothetical protein
MHTLHNKSESISIFWDGLPEVIDLFKRATKLSQYRITTTGAGKRRSFTCSNYRPYFWANEQNQDLHAGQWDFADVLEPSGFRYKYYPIISLVNVPFIVELLSKTDNEETGG